MDWGQVAANQAGVITRAQLRAAGLSDSAVTNLKGSGAVRPLARGVFLVRGAPMTYASTIWMAVLALNGVVGFGTAAHLWGCTARPPCVDLLIPEARRVTELPGIRLRRCYVAPRQVVFRSGFPITTRSCSLLDHLGEGPDELALRLADRGLQQGWITRDDIAQRLANQPGRAGNARLRRIFAQTADGAAAESERRLHALLRSARITDWHPNYPVWHHGELVAVVDVAFPERRIAVEIDGLAYHVDADRFQRDRTRANALTALGWTIYRFTWADLIHRPEHIVRTLRRAAA